MWPSGGSVRAAALKKLPRPGSVHSDSGRVPLSTAAGRAYPHERRLSVVVSGDLSELQERAARNESRYRALNERMKAHNAMHVWVDPPMPDWVCECASLECMKPVRLTQAEYEAVRAEPTHFFVVPSEEHLTPAVEDVVERHERYWVLEKIEEAAEVSEELDPRSGPDGPQEL